MTKKDMRRKTLGRARHQAQDLRQKAVGQDRSRSQAEGKRLKNQAG